MYDIYGDEDPGIIKEEEPHLHTKKLKLEGCVP